MSITVSKSRGTAMASLKKLIPVRLLPCMAHGCWRRGMRLYAYCPKHANRVSPPCRDCSWVPIHDTRDRLMSIFLVALCDAHRPAEQKPGLAFGTNKDGEPVEVQIDRAPEDLGSDPAWQEKLRTRTPRNEDERGSMVPFVVVITVALLAVAGLVIDGGYALGAKREAMTSAEQAARVGADALDTGALRSGQTRVDPGRAVAAAEGYLSSVGANGSVQVNGGEVTVTVTKRQKTAILSAVGVGRIPVNATATAVSIDQDD
ncbi:MAG: pilus assembly protein TadG-related protein [Pseudonocardiaceae bacterium]